VTSPVKDRLVEPTFAEVAHARFRANLAPPDVMDEAESEYRHRLQAFQAANGAVLGLWFGFRSRTAAVLTNVEVAARKGTAALEVVSERPLEPKISELLRDVEALQILTVFTLSSTPRRIASQWEFSLATSLLAIADKRYDDAAAESPDVAKWELDRIRSEIERVRDYVTRAASRVATVRYLTGVLAGFAIGGISVAVAVAAGVGLTDHLAIVAAFAGAVGATVSVFARRAGVRGQAETLPSVRVLVPLGSIRVVAGAVFGLAAFLLIDSGLISIRPENGDLTSFYAVIGFFAGFAERFTQVLVSGPGVERGDLDHGPQLQPATTRLLEAVPERVEATVADAISDAIYGPPLANFRGFVWAAIDSSSVNVSIGREPPSDAVSAEIAIDNGVELPEVEFAVQLDSDSADLRSPRQLLRVRPDGPPLSVGFAFDPELVSEEVGLWIRVTQRGRLVQLFDPRAAQAENAGT
jgi:hypothetical protein